MLQPHRCAHRRLRRRTRDPCLRSQATRSWRQGLSSRFVGFQNADGSVRERKILLVDQPVELDASVVQVLIDNLIATRDELIRATELSE
jgi:hypothetical protein